MASELLVKLDTKRILAEDFRDGKKRVCLNKVREIRKTKAGGFAQNKYQKHVEILKSKTVEWATSNLGKPGVLRFPYDSIRLDIKDPKIQGEIRRFLLDKNDASKL